MTTLRTRRTVTDNLGTRHHPVPRLRLATPLTLRAVRRQMLAAPEWLDETQAAEWLEARRIELPRLLTELDRLLTDEEAITLERYVANEEMLAGNARVPEWLGERVQTSARMSAPLPDAALETLASHVAAKKALTPFKRSVLTAFVAQQLDLDAAMSAAEAALFLRLPGRNKRYAWWQAVAAAAARLVRMRY